MKQFVATVFCIVFLFAGWMAIEANAQASAAQTG